MTAGPLVVFGFLVLPALAALRVAPGLVAAFAISAAIAAFSFLGGFWLSYRADLPAGPVCVAVVAACWALANGAMRLRAPRARGAAALLLALLASLPAALARLRVALRDARRNSRASRCRAARCPSRWRRGPSPCCRSRTRRASRCACRRGC